MQRKESWNGPSPLVDRGWVGLRVICGWVGLRVMVCVLCLQCDVEREARLEC